MSEFIVRTDAFRAAWSQVTAVIDPVASLPGQVFRRPPAIYSCFEYDQIFLPVFWRTMTELAVQCGDRTITCVELSPDPETLAAFGHYRAFVLPVEAPASRFEQIVRCEPEGWPGNSLYMVSERLGFASTSDSVVVWGARSTEIAIMGLYKGAHAALPKLPRLLPWLSAARALELMSVIFEHQIVPPTFRNEFVRHYGGAFGESS